MSHNHAPDRFEDHDARLERWQSFDHFWATSGQLIFVRSGAVRASSIHQGSLPRGCYALPGNPADPDGPCHGCRSFANDLTVKMHGLALAWIDQHHQDPTPYLIKATPDRARDVIRERASRQGLPTRPERAAQAGWITEVLPNPQQRRLLELMLFYVQSNDEPAPTPWPVDRFANRIGVDPDVVDRWVDEVPAQLAATGPAGDHWVRRNLLGPLGARLTTDAAVKDATPVVERPVPAGHAAPPSPVEDALVADELRAQVDVFLAAVQRLVAAGLGPIEAVADAANTCLDPDDAARLLMRPDLAEAADRIVAWGSER